MMKKFVSLLVVLCMAFALCAPVCAEEAVAIGEVQTVNAITVKVNGQVIDCVSYGQEPVIVEGRTLVPLRAVFEALGATVEWDNETRTVVSERGDVKISLTVDSNKLFVDGVEKTIDVPACIMNDRTMVPVRAVAEAFGCTVEWDNDNRCVIITDVKESVEEATEVVEEVTEIVDENADDEVKKAAAEQAVLNFWGEMNKNDYAAASQYCDFDVQAYFDSLLEETSKESEEEGIDPDVAAELVAIYKDILDAMFAATKVEIESSEVVDENTVKIICAITMPDYEAVDTEKYLTEEKAYEILRESMAKYGYDEESYVYSDEEEATLIIIDYLINTIKYCFDALIADIDNIPTVTERGNDIVVEFIDGKWIVTEGLE